MPADSLDSGTVSAPGVQCQPSSGRQVKTQLRPLRSQPLEALMQFPKTPLSRVCGESSESKVFALSA